MKQAALLICLALTCAACAQKEPTYARSGTHASVVQGPMYASESQRARAMNYWLPQNRLPEDAGVMGQDDRR